MNKQKKITKQIIILGKATKLTLGRVGYYNEMRRVVQPTPQR